MSQKIYTIIVDICKDSVKVYETAADKIEKGDL